MKKNYKHSLLVLELKELQERFNSIEKRIKLVKKKLKNAYIANDIETRQSAIYSLFDLKSEQSNIIFWICQYKDKIKNCQRKERFYGMSRSR